ncbi:MAG TPA: rhodanese-like domain-containing protein [Candidatus Nanopelagicaceae bacterium]|nr:rhodanese-like domain-containing protein [Candidatus Nanopelagicaceae bacterium]
MSVPVPLEIEIDAARQSISQGSPVLDVREAAERISLRIPGSIWIPIEDLVKRWQELPPESPLVVQCSAGSRSFRASKFLREHGVVATAMVGGISAWLAAGGATESGPL